ncbi:MAG: 2OG-Fe(II) oxygenase family protein [Pseudomonadota bacterium]
MMKAQPVVQVGIGDPMPRITLPQAGGGLFDSYAAASDGRIRIYWAAAPPPADETAWLIRMLAGCEAELHVVSRVAPADPHVCPSWLLDRGDELARAFAMDRPLAVVVDASDRVAALFAAPTPAAVVAWASRLYESTLPEVVQAKAPVLMLERVVEPDLCRRLIAHWRRGAKMENRVGAPSGNVVNADVKRRSDVQLDDPHLFVALRDRLARRVLPAIKRSFQVEVGVIEAPIIGCYDARSGGCFRRHRDNTSVWTAHRQFAVSINLNDAEEYDGGELRFPEYGRHLYRPSAGAILAFSTSLLHEVVPVTRGCRFGAFTFLSASAPVTRTMPAGARPAGQPARASGATNRAISDST